MKRIFAMYLVVFLVLSAVGCSSQPSVKPTTTAAPETTTAAPETTTAASETTTAATETTTAASETTTAASETTTAASETTTAASETTTAATETTTATPEATIIQMADTSLKNGETYCTVIPAKSKGNPSFQMSAEGIIEITDNYWDGLNLYVEIKAISNGTVKLTTKIKGYSYQMSITVESEPTVMITADGNLCLDIMVDKTDATVYIDDTTVTYTVITAPTVDTLIFEQIASKSPLSSYNSVISGSVSVFTLATLTVNDSTLTGTVTAADNQSTYTARKELQDGQLVWTVQWNLGYTAVSLLRVTACDSSAGTSHTNYLHLNIKYPVFDPSQGLENIALFWLKLNIDEPLLFTIDTSKLTKQQQLICNNYDKAGIFESEAFMMSGTLLDRNSLNEMYYLQTGLSILEYYDLMFDSSPLFHKNTIDTLDPYGLISVALWNDEENLDYYPQFNNKQRLVTNYYFEDVTYIFYGSFSSDVRAVMAYLYDFEIDKDVFPYAYSILQNGGTVIDKIITDDMTDFEKEKAIYDWMIKNYNSGLKALSASASVTENYYVLKTSYGLLNGYHGDCSGWSATFFTLCNMAGLPCSTVDVLAEAGGPIDYSFFEDINADFTVDHRINLVRIDGEYYFVEVYWFYQKTSSSDGDYRYMNMTTAQAAQHYTWINEACFGPMEFNYTSFLVDANTGELLNK